MNSVERVKNICKERKIPISKIEKELGFSNGYISQLRKGVFPDDRLKKIADYFNVTIDYLMTGEEKNWHPTLNENDEKDIQKQLQRTLDQLENETGLMFDGNYMDERAKEKLKNSLELVMRGTRIEAKEKFTPKKHKK